MPIRVFLSRVISTCGVFSFSVSYAYFVLRCLLLVLPSFIHAESVHEFALLLACCYSRSFKVCVIISCCIFSLSYCFGYALVVGFSNTHRCLFQINVFCGSRAEVVSRQFLFPDSVERVLEPRASFR